MDPLVPAVSTLGDDVGDVSRAAQLDRQVLEEVVVVRRPGVFAVEPGVRRHSLLIGVGGGGHVAVGNRTVLNAERLGGSANVRHGYGRGEGEEASDEDQAETRRPPRRPTPTSFPSIHCFFSYAFITRACVRFMGMFFFVFVFLDTSLLQFL